MGCPVGAKGYLCPAESGLPALPHSSRRPCGFLHLPPYTPGEGNAWRTAVPRAEPAAPPAPSPGLGQLFSAPPPSPSCRPRPRGGGGNWGAGRAAHLRGESTSARRARGRRLAPRCAPLRAPRSGPGPAPSPPQRPRPPPPPRAGRAGGVVRAARVTARSSRGASPGRSVSAHCPPRAAQPAGRCRPSPRPRPRPRPAADGSPRPGAPAAAAAAAETMDAGAAPRKHSRCRASPGAAPGARWTRGGAAVPGDGSGRRGEGARAAPLGGPLGRRWAERPLRSGPGGQGSELGGDGQGCGLWCRAGQGRVRAVLEVAGAG